ncbi:MAG: cupredoxin domain-containing protein [Chloroflexota bacterium]
MRRHVAIVAMIWAVLTVAGLVFIQIPFQPPVGSDKGQMIDDTFMTLLLMSVPVFTFVIAGLGYSIVVFRHHGEPDEDGAPLTGRGPIPLAWFAVTSLMAVGVMVYPGLTELPKVVALDSQPDVVVQIKGLQWAWQLTYPGQNVVTSKELVLPVSKKVGFEISSQDVIHSVWVPAFRMRIDAVPGLTTYMSFTPTHTGSYADDPNMRLQCSQLCGGNHALMMVPVRVVSDADFAQWAKDNASGGAGTPIDGAQEVTVQAANAPGTVEYHFATTTVSAKPGQGIKLTFDNTDKGITHNIAVQSPDGTTTLRASAFEAGPTSQVIWIDGLQPGSYPFLCQAHPTTMKGILEVK